jgi:hypothetical protein
MAEQPARTTCSGAHPLDVMLSSARVPCDDHDRRFPVPAASMRGATWPIRRRS